MVQHQRYGGAPIAAQLFAILSVALVLSAGLAPPASAQVPPARSFRYNSLMTTKYGPAAADVVVEPSNMISCALPTRTPLAYALCYYSGPAAATGIAAGNPALPCVLSRDGKSANCTCFKVTKADYANPYQIDINGVLNRDIYLNTVRDCGHNGAKCAAGSPTVAPACTAVNAGVMMPRANIVSVFSLYNLSAYSAGKKPGSTACASAKYAGCMTAPCHDLHKTAAGGQALVSCRCPTFMGPYQVGQDGATCDANLVTANAKTGRKRAPIYVWSASRVIGSSGGQ